MRWHDEDLLIFYPTGEKMTRDLRYPSTPMLVLWGLRLRL